MAQIERDAELLHRLMSNPHGHTPLMVAAGSLLGAFFLFVTAGAFAWVAFTSSSPTAASHTERTDSTLQLRPLAPTVTFGTFERAALKREAKTRQKFVGVGTVTRFQSYAGADSVFVQLEGTSTTFGGGQVVYSETAHAIQRARAFVGHAAIACGSTRCYQQCDHLAGVIWGYSDYSGYPSAISHWRQMVSAGQAHAGDRNPPLGSLLYWATGPYGHVATYVGHGMVVSNSVEDQGANVYALPADGFESQGARYLGWSAPIFFGERPGTALS